MTLFDPNKTQAGADPRHELLARSMTREFPLYFIVNVTDKEKDTLSGFIEKLGQTLATDKKIGIAIITDLGKATASNSLRGTMKKSLLDSTQNDFDRYPSNAYKSAASALSLMQLAIKDAAPNTVQATPSASPGSNIFTTITGHIKEFTNNPVIRDNMMNRNGVGSGTVTGAVGSIKSSIRRARDLINSNKNPDIPTRTMNNATLGTGVVQNIAAQQESTVADSLNSVAIFTQQQPIESVINQMVLIDGKPFEDAISRLTLLNIITVDQGQFLISNSTMATMLVRAEVGNYFAQFVDSTINTVSSEVGFRTMVESVINVLEAYQLEDVFRVLENSIPDRGNESGNSMFPHRVAIRMPFAPTSIKVNSNNMTTKTRVRGGFNIQRWGHDLPVINMEATTSYFQVESWKYKLMQILNEFAYNRMYISADGTPAVNDAFYTRPMPSMLYDGLEYVGYMNNFNLSLTANEPYQIKYSIEFVVTKVPDFPIERVVEENRIKLW